MSLSRRDFLSLALGSLALSGCSRSLFVLDQKNQHNEFDYRLILKETPISILPNTITPAFTFNGAFPAPIIRAKQGQPIRIHVTNQLNQPTTIHWHGIRINNAMDGVPFLTQPPILPGETFVYDFVCPDAGTFWYHPHTNSLEQLSKGLVGVLIVEEAEPLAYDHEVILQLKDWLLAPDGGFLPFSSPRQAARMGTLGNVKTVNGQFKPVIEIPAGGAIRTRLLNIDNTRVYAISTKDFKSTVLALDGNAVAKPFPLATEKIGAGMRLDLGFIAPQKVGEEIIIYDKKGRLHFELCRLRTVDSSLPHKTKLPFLPLNPIPAPNLKEAERLSFVFEWAGALSPTDSMGKVKSQFWTINKRAWEGMSAKNMPAPLANLSLGKTYLIDLHNATPHMHPIHLHGYTFTVIKSDKRAISPYHTDTILMEKNERAQIAFVADNPGDWMFHCHVIEHMKTGLMGYIRVT